MEFVKLMLLPLVVLCIAAGALLAVFIWAIYVLCKMIFGGHTDESTV